jgi:nicotinate-nucleotide adenylyltransferase
MNTANPLENFAAKPSDIIILGGTFDPIHLGHIASVEHVSHWLGIKHALLIPAHIPPHKNQTDANSQQRAEMVKLVCQTKTNFSFDQRELLRPTHSFTVETLIELKQETPQSRLFFIMGMDSLIHFTNWEQWQKILTLCHIVVNPRPNYSINDLTKASYQLLSPFFHLQGQTLDGTGKILFSPQMQVPLSSTQIRAAIKNQQNYQQYLPTSILKFIKKQKLYRSH